MSCGPNLIYCHLTQAGCEPGWRTRIFRTRWRQMLSNSPEIDDQFSPQLQILAPGRRVSDILTPWRANVTNLRDPAFARAH